MKNLIIIFFLVVPKIIWAQSGVNYGNTLTKETGYLIKADDNFVYTVGATFTNNVEFPIITKFNKGTYVKVWEKRLDISARINDLSFIGNDNTPAEMFLVGNTLPSGSSINNSSLLLKLNTASGNLDCSKIYNHSGGESFTRIIRHPNPSNSSYPYYILGAKAVTGAVNFDVTQMFLLNVSADCNASNFINFSRQYAQATPIDDEFHRGLIPISGGSLLLTGNRVDGGLGLIVVINGAGVVSEAKYNSWDMEIEDGIQLANGNFIFVAEDFSVSPRGAMIFMTDTKFEFLTGKSYPELNGFRDVFLDGNFVYTIGNKKETGNGLNEFPVIMKFNITNSPSVSITEIFSRNVGHIVGTSYTGGNLDLKAGKLHYIDSRTTLNNIGNIYIAESDINDNFECQGTVSLMPTIPDFSVTNTPVTSSSYTLPFATTLTAVNASFTTVLFCPLTVPCTVNFESQFGECGNVNFTSTTNLISPVTYSWTFGTTPQSTSALKNPVKKYLANGTYQVCLTVSSGNSSCNICKSITISNADTQAPVVTCQSNVQLTNNPGQCYATYAPQVTVTDNCDPMPTCNCVMTGVTSGPMIKNTLTQFNVGITTVTCTATDASGNVSIPCIFTVTVFDAQAPNIVCPPNVTISCTQNQDDYMITGQAAATDNCPGVIIAHTDIFSGNTCSGTITRTWRATDASGAIVTCVQLIKKEDKVAPVMSCPVNVTINCTQNPLPTLTGTALAVDDCQPGPIVPTFNDVTVGTGCSLYINRTWTANDGCGNIATCLQKIHFKDDIAPVVTCPPNLTINCIGNDWQTANYGNATATDNCSTPTIFNFNRTLTGTNCNGEIKSWWRAIDACGIQNECVQTITIMDNVAPLITCPPNITVSCNDNTNTSNTGTATAIDNCSGNNVIRFTDALPPQGCTQIIVRTWTATDACGNVSTCVQTITLKDDVAPSISCPPNLTLNCGANTNPAATGNPVTSDFCQTNLSVTFIDATSGTPCNLEITRTWTVNDGCGNTSTCIQIITVNDISAPTIFCPPSNLNPIECAANPNLGVLTNVADNCGGKIDQSNVDVLSINGCITIINRTWTVTDQCGNSATCAQTITMQDTKPPVITNCGKKYTIQGIRNIDGNCIANVTVISPNVTDLCDGTVTLTNSFNNTSNASGTYAMGQTILIWTAKDDCGLMTMCRDTVLVLECPNCCWDENAFNAVAATEFSIIRDECSIHISHPGLTPCQRVTYTWSTGVSSGYLTGTANASHDYVTSGDYTICALIEEVDVSGMVCFSAEKCYEVCVTCGDGCMDDRIVYECHDFSQVTRYQGSRNLTRYDLVHSNGFIYAANSIKIAQGDTDATITKMDANNCIVETLLIFGGSGFDEASSIKVNSSGTKMIVAGIYESFDFVISSSITMSGSNITMSSIGGPGIWNGFLLQIDIGTMKVDWAFSLGDGWRDNINDIAFDNNDNIYIVGSIRGQGTSPVVNFAPLGISNQVLTLGLASMYATDVYTGFVAKYDTNGRLIMYDVIQPYGMYNPRDGNASIGCNSIDIEGSNIYVGGYFQAGIPYVNGPSAINLPSQTIVIQVDINDVNKTTGWSNFVIKYDLNLQRNISQEIYSGLGDVYVERNQLRSLKLSPTDIFVGGSNFITKLDKNTLTQGLSYNSVYEINDIKVSGGMLYTIGSTTKGNPNLDFINSSPPYSVGIDIPIGIYDLDLNLKKNIILGGGRIEFGYGIEVVGNNFFVQGMSQSLDFKYDPPNGGIISAAPASDDANIFLGKYSCACEPNTDCCEDVSASFSGPEKCCKSLNLVNNAGFDISQVTIELITPDWILNTTGGASGYIYNPIANGIEITHTSGSLPTGTLNSLLETCLTGIPAASTSQQFVVNWYENSTSGNELVSCSDTLTMACNPAPPPLLCVKVNDIVVECDSENPNVYNVTFTVTNLTTNIQGTTAYLSGLPSDYLFNSCSGGTLSGSIALSIFPILAPGATSLPLCVQIYSLNPILNSESICFNINLKGLIGNILACCTEDEEMCVSLAPCCTPCDAIDITSSPLESEDDRCCYTLNVENNCEYAYFTKIEAEILTNDVHFGYLSTGTNWNNCTPPTLQEVCISPNAGTVGAGTLNNILEFCLTNINNASQIPQNIDFTLYAIDSTGNEVVACNKMLQFQCDTIPNDSCLIVTNAIAYCNPENEKYTISVTIQNNSSPDFCANEVVITPLQSGVAMPSVIVLSDFLCYGESTTINFMLNTNPFPDADGLFPVIFSLKNSLSGYCCRGGIAHIDTLVLPDCPCATLCCDSDENEDFENIALGNLPNNQVGWVNHQGSPQVVSGGANGSAQCIGLNAGIRGVRPGSVSYGMSGVVGPEIIFKENKLYCITFWAKLFPALNLYGRLGVYADGQLIGTVVIPSSNTLWTQYSFNFIAPPPGQEILIFTNESPAPADAGPSILLDQVCFEEIVQIFDDTTPPALTCPANLTINDTDNDCMVSYTIPNITVTDANGVESVTCYLDGTPVNIGSIHNLSNTLVHMILFVAEDICGNKDSCSYTITVRCQQCTCPATTSSFTLKPGNNATVNLSCGQPLTSIPTIDCPTAGINITGNFGCVLNSPVGSCPPNAISWTLDRPVLGDLTGTLTGPVFNWNQVSANLSDAGLYILTIKTLCSASVDSCLCVLKWNQRPCPPIDTCCKDERAFYVNTQYAVLPGKDEKDCKAFVNIDLLNPCIKIDKIDWGNGTSTNGPLPTGQTYYSPTLTNGNYTIVVTFSEYNTSGAKCWTNDVGFSIDLQCINPLCSCKYVYFKIEKDNVDCNNAPVKISCPNKTPVFISGNLGCTPTGCGTGTIQYNIRNSSNVSVTSGTFMAQYFNLQLLAGWFDPLGGQYSMELVTICGNNTCRCKLNFIVPACPKSCLCDDNFAAEVSLGFSTQHYTIPVCRKKFTPKNLCPNDKVKWTLNGIAMQSSTGTNPVIFNILPANSTVCMIVERMESPNKICRDTFCQFFQTCKYKLTPSLICQFPKNSTFDGGIDGSFSDGGMMTEWTLKSGRGVVISDEGIDFENVLLIANKNNPSDLYQNCCLDPLGQKKILSNIQLNIQNYGYEKLQEGSKIKIFSAPSDVTVTDLDIKGEIDISAISFGWSNLSLALQDVIWEYNNLVIRFENPNENDAFIRIDNLCLDFVSGTADVDSKNNFYIYPNPTTGHLTIQFTSSTEQDLTLKVMDVLGREVSRSTINIGSTNYSFNIDDFAGIYIIQLTDKSGNSSQRKVIKIE